MRKTQLSFSTSDWEVCPIGRLAMLLMEIAARRFQKYQNPNDMKLVLLFLYCAGLALASFDSNKPSKCVTKQLCVVANLTLPQPDGTASTRRAEAWRELEFRVQKAERHEHEGFNILSPLHQHILIAEAILDGDCGVWTFWSWVEDNMAAVRTRIGMMARLYDDLVRHAPDMIFCDEETCTLAQALRMLRTLAEKRPSLVADFGPDMLWRLEMDLKERYGLLNVELNERDYSKLTLADGTDFVMRGDSWTFFWHYVQWGN